MFGSTADISALWALMWGWAMAHTPTVIVGLLTAVLVLPVVFSVAKTIARAVCQHRDHAVLPVAMTRQHGVVNTIHGAARPAVNLRAGVAVLEEGFLVSPESPPPNLLQMTFSNVQPPPCANEVRMIKMLKAMYTLLGQTLDGASSSMSAVERMSAACSLVSRTVATFESWRAPAAVLALLQPAKDVTDLFSRRSTKKGSGAMSKGRQAHYVAVLKNRAQTMEEVLAQALWAKTMPIVPSTIRDAVPVLALAGKPGGIGPKKSTITTGKLGRKGKAGITPGVQHIPYPHPCQLADSRIMQ
eukprot:g16430.t1